MEEVLKFLKEARDYYLATVENGKPRVRPFGTINLFNGKLYVQTGKRKNVAKQLKENPYFELCAFKDGDWLRVSGKLILDDNREARVSMLDAYPELKSMYDVDDGNTEVYYIEDGEAVFSSFTKPERKVRI